MNPFDTFIAFRPRGLATALIEAFASVKQLREVDPDAAVASLLAIALSLPPTPEWSGLSGELKLLCQPRTKQPPLTLSEEQKEKVKTRLAELHRMAAATPGGWSDELEEELDRLMSGLERR